MGAACAGATGVGAGVDSSLVFSCSGGVGWLGVDIARNGTGTFQGAVSAEIMNQLKRIHTLRCLLTPIKERDVYENIVNRDFEGDAVVVGEWVFSGSRSQGGEHDSP